MKKRIYTVSTILWMIVIFVFSAKTSQESGEQSQGLSEMILRFFINNPSENVINTFETIIRKIGHLSEYAILGILAYNTLSAYNVKTKKLMILISFCFLYAVSDEIHQIFVPGRAGRWYDVLIDTIGAYLGYIICILFSKIKLKLGKA